MLAECRKALCNLGRLFLSVMLQTSLKGPSFQKEPRTSENLSLSGCLNLTVQRHLVFKVDKKSESLSRVK